MAEINIDVNGNLNEDAKRILNYSENREEKRLAKVAELYKYTVNLLLDADLNKYHAKEDCKKSEYTECDDEKNETIKWIPFKKFNPPMETRVLITQEGKPDITVARLTIHGWAIETTLYPYLKVAAWAMLPEGYKEDESEEH